MRGGVDSVKLVEINITITNTMKDSKKLDIVKNIVFTEFHGYSLISETKNSLSFRKDVPGTSPSCAVAGCLLIFGIVPGLAYYFLAKRDPYTYTINVKLSKKKVSFIGDEPRLYKLKELFNAETSRK